MQYEETRFRELSADEIICVAGGNDPGDPGRYAESMAIMEEIIVTARRANPGAYVNMASYENRPLTCIA